MLSQALTARQIIGVGAAVVGDMSSRPYWGLYELDFVFSTLVVRSLAPSSCTTNSDCQGLLKLRGRPAL